MASREVVAGAVGASSGAGGKRGKDGAEAFSVPGRPLAERLPEQLEAASQPGLHRRDRAAGELGDLVRTAVVVVAQEERRAIERGQLGERGAELLDHVDPPARLELRVPQVDPDVPFDVLGRDRVLHEPSRQGAHEVTVSQ